MCVCVCMCMYVCVCRYKGVWNDCGGKGEREKLRERERGAFVYLNSLSAPDLAGSERAREIELS